MKLEWSKVICSKRIFEVILIIVFIHSNVSTIAISTPTFTYYEGSLFIEVDQAYFNLTLNQGTYNLVIENMGLISGETSFRGTASVDYVITLPEKNAILEQMSWSGPFALTSNSYATSPFVIDEINSIVSFNITASNPISLFVTDQEGRDEFYSEMFLSPRKQQPSIGPEIQLLLIVGGLVVVSMFIILYRRIKVKGDEVISSAQNNIDELWKCPNDQFPLQIRMPTTSAQNPQFNINRQSIEVGISNAIAMKKIPQEAAHYTQEVVNRLFLDNPTLDYIEMISASCNKCGLVVPVPKKEL
jgi:hypothetical protein